MDTTLPKNSIVLVTGGTGFTGAVLVKKLINQGVTVRVIARPSPRVKELQDLGCVVYEGQVYDKAVVEEASKDVDYIFHVAAAYREAGIKDEIYYRVHVESTKYLAECSLKNKNLKRFVHVSTIGVHGHIEEPPADENYRYSPGDQYQITKLEGELWIREFAKNNNLPLSVIRPAAIYGPGDRRLLKLFKMGKWPIVPLLGFGKCLYHLTHVEDLTNSFLLAALHPKALNEVFICGAEEPIAMKDIVSIVAKELNKKPIFIRIPVTPFFLLGDLCELLCKPLGIEPPIYRRRVAFFTKDRAFNTAKIRNVLGFEYQFSNKTGIIQTLKWYLDNGWM
jgi:nucleoside-diphosphate-sugar epimerase